MKRKLNEYEYVAFDRFASIALALRFDRKRMTGGGPHAAEYHDAVEHILTICDRMNRVNNRDRWMTDKKGGKKQAPEDELA